MRKETDILEMRVLDKNMTGRLRKSLKDEEIINQLAETYKVLSDPTRLRICSLLAEAELCVSDLAALLDISESAASHQLRLLRSLRLVRHRRDGKMVFYALDDEHVIGLIRQGLDHVEEKEKS
jgi:ArsR family transcriptional regulator, lead/cadmium/zinc/bismuth-responsive transcriptional repressor